MGCRSDHMDPTPREQYCQLTAQLYVFVHQKLGQEVPSYLFRTANQQYAATDYTAALCGTLSELSEQDRDFIVYNGREPMSRKLADWWEQHQAVDAKHAAQDAAKAHRAFAIAKVKAYLTPAEFASLNIKED